MPSATKAIEKFTCKWDETNPTFVVTCSILQTDVAVEQDIQSVFTAQKYTFENLTASLPLRPVIPLTRGFLRLFGPDAKQLCSGESVIRNDDLIYKRTFFEKEKERLHYLLRYRTNRPSKCVFPQDSIIRSHNLFFLRIYQMPAPTINKNECTNHFEEWIV